MADTAGKVLLPGPKTISLDEWRRRSRNKTGPKKERGKIIEVVPGLAIGHVGPYHRLRPTGPKASFFVDVLFCKCHFD